MQTSRTLRTIRQPSRVDRLLHAFITSSTGLSEIAYMVRDWAFLPEVLRTRITGSERSGCSWECWVDGEHTWLFIADAPPGSADERGNPVLRICRYGQDGQLQDTGHWVSDPQHRWRRLADEPAAQ
jgi:hypothetical protein